MQNSLAILHNLYFVNDACNNVHVYIKIKCIYMGTKYIFIYSHRLSRHVCMIAISVCIQKSTRIIFYIFVVYMPLYIFIHYTYSVCLDGQIYKYMYLCTCCLSIVSQLACILYGYIHKFIHPCRNV